MKGSIRIALGFLIVLGAAGASDIEPVLELWEIISYSIFGLLLMSSGVAATNKQNV
jgi:hypothetical protein